MRYNAGYNREGDYEHLVVNESMPLLEWLLANVQQSRSKIKATLQGRGIKVNGKTVSQFDFQLEPGMKIAISKTKRNQNSFKSRYVKIVYEDKWLIVIEKAEGILSMAAGHSSLNVKTVLDDYFKKSRQKCVTAAEIQNCFSGQVGQKRFQRRINDQIVGILFSPAQFLIARKELFVVKNIMHSCFPSTGMVSF